MTIDPTDDCTFWFSEEYQKVNGGFDWSTAIGNFSFPGCGGGGGNPVVSLNPITLAFKKVGIGLTSAPKSVTLTNTGNATLNLASVTVTGDYQISSNTCGATVDAGASCVVSVTLTPTKKGSRKGTLSFTDNAAGSPQTVPLTGSGQSIGLIPNSLNFGTVTVGTTSAPQSVTVHNGDVTTVNLTGFTITGATTDYSISSNTCGASLAPGANCSIGITFKPTKKAIRNGKLNVLNNGAGSTAIATLTGVGG